MNRRVEDAQKHIVAIGVVVTLLLFLAACIMLPAEPPVPPVPVEPVMPFASAGKPYTTDKWLQSAVVTTTNGSSLDVTGAAVVNLQVSGTYTTATVSFETTTDATNWVALQCVDTADGSVDTTTTANGVWQCPVSGQLIRARVTWTSGTSISVFGQASSAGALTVADIDIAGAETVSISGDVTVNDPISMTIGSVAPQLDATDHVAVSLYGKSSAAGDKEVLLDSSGNTLVKPFASATEFAVTELVGINEQIDQYDYSEDVTISLGGTYSGEILGCVFYSSEDGSGQVQKPAGTLIFFDNDPAVSSGDTAIVVAQWLSVTGKITIYGSDWITDTNGGIAYSDDPVAFHALSDLHAVWYHQGSVSLNSAAGDDERLRFACWYRRDS